MYTKVSRLTAFQSIIAVQAKSALPTMNRRELKESKNTPFISILEKGSDINWKFCSDQTSSQEG